MQPNTWKPSNRVHRPAVLLQPIEEAGCWYPKDLAGTDAWVYRLSEREASEIVDAVAAVARKGLDIKNIRSADFDLPTLAPALRDIKRELMEGRGFALIRGLSIEGMTPYDYTAAFWGVSTYLGRAISQNAEGHLIGHVTNKGNSMQTPTGRGYRSSEELQFHCDRCDIAGLMTLRLAKAGGQHRICSSVSVYNEMLKRRPELAEALTFHFYMSRRGEIPAGETEPWFRQPVFSVRDGYFSARGASRTGIVRAQKLPGVPQLTAEQLESIDVYQEIANELAIDVDFEPGDMSYAQSHVTLHMRTEFEDWPEADRRRHLLRMWINTGGERPLVPEVGREIERGVTLDGVGMTVPLEA
jgi:hypothetical protein